MLLILVETCCSAAVTPHCNVTPILWSSCSLRPRRIYRWAVKKLCRPPDESSHRPYCREQVSLTLHLREENTLIDRVCAFRKHYGSSLNSTFEYIHCQHRVIKYCSLFYISLCLYCMFTYLLLLRITSAVPIVNLRVWAVCLACGNARIAATKPMLYFYFLDKLLKRKCFCECCYHDRDQHMLRGIRRVQLGHTALSPLTAAEYRLIPIKCIMCQNRTKVYTALPLSLNNKHAKCEANKRKSSQDMQSTYTRRQTFVELVLQIFLISYSPVCCCNTAYRPLPLLHQCQQVYVGF